MERTAAPKLPVDGKRNILVTSALPYVNNVPHLGNIIGCVLSADVFARYCRLRGYNAIYICGTDEYGTAMEVKALLEKCSPREICDRYHKIHKEVYDWFQISFDKFGRTSAPEHTELCQGIFNTLLENKFLFESTMQQLYCNQCELFLADSFVVGMCPNPDCCNEQAKGDQCENCGKMLDPTELRNPMCKLCKGTPVLRDTRHFFIDLPSLCGKLESYICKTSHTGCWSHYAVSNTRGLLHGGLRPRCITRDLRWGVPVPLDDYGEKVLYVWFDAPIGYISITKSYTPEWEKWWKNPETVELYQFMGKDNVQFHTVMFPSVLLGTGENWTMAKSISSTQFLNYLTGKFSKSQGVGINGKQAKETNIPVEVWRYYLLCNRPEVSDTRFCWDDLQAKLNRELIANLGNFVNRVLRFLAKPPGQGYGSIIPDITGAESDELTQKFGERIGEYVDLYVEEMEKVKLKRGLKVAMLISSEGNSYLQESKFWILYKKERPKCSIVLKTSVGVVYLLACLLEPFMPSVSAEVMKQLNFPYTMISLQDEDRKRARTPWQIVPPGHEIGQPKPLFNELTDKELEVFKMKFAGCQTSGSVENERDAVSRLVKDGNKQLNGNENSDVKGSDGSCGSRVGHVTEAQKFPVAEPVRVKEIEVNEGPPVVAGNVKSCLSLEEIQGMKACASCGVNPIIIHDKSESTEVVATSNGELLKVGSINLVEVAADSEMVSGVEREPNRAIIAEGVVRSVRGML